MKVFFESGCFLIFSAKNGRIFCRLLVSWKSSRFPTFFIDAIYFSYHDINARNFSFSFIICPLTVKQNAIDFGRKQEKGRKRLQLDISPGPLLILTWLFDLGDLNFQTVRVDGRIYSLSLKYTIQVAPLFRLSNSLWFRSKRTLFSVTYSLWQSNPLWPSNTLWNVIWEESPYYSKTFVWIFRPFSVNFKRGL